MVDYKEELGKIIDEIQQELNEEKMKNNRLAADNVRIKNAMAGLIEVIERGGEICRQLKM